MEYDNHKGHELRNAFRMGMVERVKELLMDPTVDLNDTTNNDNARTPFIYACICSNVEIANALLECKKSIDYNKKDANGIPALHYATSEVLPLLLEDPRIDVNALDSRGVSILSENIYAGASITIVMRIFAAERFTQVNAVDDEGFTALDKADNLGPPELEDMIRAHIEDPVVSRTKLRNSFGDYPEHLAGELFAIVVLLCDDYLEMK